MYREIVFKKYYVFLEMWLVMMVFYYGFKVVYVFYFVFVDRVWLVDYFVWVFNGGRNGVFGGGRILVYGDKEYNMRGLMWFYNVGFSGNLYRWWMGFKVNNDGGE